ncbi:unnamed protein product [Pleuronectes platessa]|uniref:Uncharacterized protein n=1 Tax=Pleuronectes platessa TaxID=8262 RepID=A0A9N7TMN9_PLEPL|nr:unnamed protein product [Pleuronectes platessa]
MNEDETAGQRDMGTDRRRAERREDQLQCTDSGRVGAGVTPHWDETITTITGVKMESTVDGVYPNSMYSRCRTQAHTTKVYTLFAHGAPQSNTDTIVPGVRQSFD